MACRIDDACATRSNSSTIPVTVQGSPQRRSEMSAQLRVCDGRRALRREPPCAHSLTHVCRRAAPWHTRQCDSATSGGRCRVTAESCRWCRAPAPCGGVGRTLCVVRRGGLRSCQLSRLRLRRSHRALSHTRLSAERGARAGPLHNHTTPHHSAVSSVGRSRGPSK